MQKIGQMIQRHLDGNQNEISAKILSSASEQLKQAGFKAPFKIEKIAGYSEAKKKGKDGKSKKAKYNPWAVCNSSSPKKENSEKFESCVRQIKKKQGVE